MRVSSGHDSMWMRHPWSFRQVQVQWLTLSRTIASMNRFTSAA